MQFAAVFKDIGFRASMLKKGGQHMAPEVLRRLQEDERKMKELIAKEEHEADLIQAGMRMASGDVADAHDKVDALEAFITYSAADYKLWHDRKADWDKAMTKFAEFAFGLVKTKPPTPLLLTNACIDDMAEGEPAYKGGLALLLWHPFERGCLKVFAATEGSEYETGMNVKEKSGMPASIDVWAAIHVSHLVVHGGRAGAVWTIRQVGSNVKSVGGRVWRLRDSTASHLSQRVDCCGLRPPRLRTAGLHTLTHQADSPPPASRRERACCATRTTCLRVPASARWRS